MPFFIIAGGIGLIDLWRRLEKRPRRTRGLVLGTILTIGVSGPFARQLLSLMPELPEQLRGEERALLATLVPELAGLASAPESATPAELQQAASQLILRATELHPLLIAVDDVERADEASLLLLAVLARAAATSRLLLIATVADRADGETHASVGFELFTKSCSERPGSDVTLSAIVSLPIRLMVPGRWGSISVPSSFTVTDVLRGVMLRVTWYSVGMADRISIEPENGAKPSPCTSRRYTPKGRSLATRFPPSSVTSIFRS